MSDHHLVIVGAGFAGLKLAHDLKGAPLRITVIDQRNHHLFQPLLYQVATTLLATSEIAWPIRRLFRNRPEVTTLLGQVVGVDRGGRPLPQLGLLGPRDRHQGVRSGQGRVLDRAGEGPEAVPELIGRDGLDQVLQGRGGVVRPRLRGRADPGDPHGGVLGDGDVAALDELEAEPDETES